MFKKWYVKIVLRNREDNRKVWYANGSYLCDCVNGGFRTKDEAIAYIPTILERFSNNLESVTVHWTR